MEQSVPVSELKVGMQVTIPGSWFRHPFIRSRFILSSQRDIEKMKHWGVKQVSVALARSDLSRGIVEGACPVEPVTGDIPVPKLQETLHDSGVAPDCRAAAVKACSTMIMQRLMESTPDEESIREAKEGFYEVIDCILEVDHLSRYLLAIRDYDAYTYTHSVNVGVLSLLVARKYFGRSDRHDLRELGIGFFLHDLGKTRINPGVIMKEGLLDDEERRMLHALLRARTPVLPLLITRGGLKIQGFESLVDMEGELARRCDARARTAYLLDPQARVLARWRRLNLDEVGKAMARSGAPGAGEPAV